MKVSNHRESPIKISYRLQPYSHLVGTSYLLPHSEINVQVYPAAIRLLSKNLIIPLNIKGPVKDFTSVLDLDRGLIKVFGEGKTGYFRYYIFANDDKINFFQDRGASILFKDAPFKIVGELPSIKKLERLSLGTSKSLDWELVKRRSLLEEILPIWFSFGQLFEYQTLNLKKNSLIYDLMISKGTQTKNRVLELFNVGFSGIFHPIREDYNFMGLDKVPLEKNAPLQVLLTEGYKKIRSFLILEKEEECHILPEILLFFPFGKVTGIQTTFGEIDIEWTKSKIRQMVIRCKKGKTISLVFPKGHKSCRLRKEDLKITLPLNCTLDLREGNHYFLSHFQK